MLVSKFIILIWVSALSVMMAEPTVLGADLQSKGAAIYRQSCARCHGDSGEGVKGKYDEALYGDWSVAKLTRIISKTMPEDEPGTCVGQDAEAVSKYIHQAFYSKEARAKIKPARVELVRLTNRQYLNTVADLLHQFSFFIPATNQVKGLQGRYFDSRGFRDEKKFLERIDPQIAFNYGTHHPKPEVTFTNPFSMQWRGSVMAPETGDYEFFVRTPNGIRLFINDEERPLIEATVTSGGLDEHKGSVRLLGGRAYPVLVEFFKSTEKSASIILEWKPPHGVREIIPTRQLITERVPSTLVLDVSFPPDDSSVGYERGVAVSKAWDEATTQAAVETANYVVRKLDKLSRSKPGDTNRQVKVEVFCENFMEIAFRRPLTKEQKKLFVSHQFVPSRKIEDSVKRVVLLTLKSPRFLYLGLDENKPDDFTVAERMSYALWDSLPDLELRKLAGKNQLRSKEAVEQQSLRMIQDPRARAKVQHFLHQWVQINHAEDLSKDAELYPGFTPELISDLRTSLDLFLSDVAWSQTSSYRDLLLANYIYVNQRMARFYGLRTDPDGEEEFVRTSFDPAERSGVITHPYLLAAFSYTKTSSPIHRGVFLTRNIVGRSLKAPPTAVAFNDAEFDPHLTMREKVAKLTSSQACQTCHSVINPLGFSLEQFDAVGRFRTTEKEKKIDPVSDYVTDDGSTIRFNGPRDLAEFASGSDHARNAFIEQFFHQIVKQPLLAYGSQTMTHLRQSFVASEFNLQKLMVEIVHISALHGIEKSKVTTRKKT